MAYAHPVYPSSDASNPPVTVRRYQIREKIFSLRDSFTVKDEFGQDVFTVRSKLFSFGNKLVLEDMTGNGLLKIDQDIFRLHRTYNILSTRDGESDRQLASIKKHFSLTHPKFDIESIYGQYSLEGSDILAHSYVLTKEGKIVATISRAFFTLADTYGVEIAENEDQTFILSLAIVIDQILHDNLGARLHRHQHHRHRHNEHYHYHDHHYHFRHFDK